jgi:hypothetical protein
MPSSVIRSFAYAPQQRALAIEFVSGRRYIYRDVPVDVADALASAPSRGSYFNRMIRDAYDFDEIADA